MSTGSKASGSGGNRMLGEDTSAKVGAATGMATAEQQLAQALHLPRSLEPRELDALSAVAPSVAVATCSCAPVCDTDAAWCPACWPAGCACMAAVAWACRWWLGPQFSMVAAASPWAGIAKESSQTSTYRNTDNIGRA